MKLSGIVFSMLIISAILIGCSSTKVHNIDDVDIVKDSIDKSIESDLDTVDSDLVDIGELDTTQPVNVELASDMESVDSELVEIGELI